MKGIDLNQSRLGADGIERSWHTIGQEFLSLFKDKIENKLKNIDTSQYDTDVQEFHGKLLKNLEAILIGEPEILDFWRNEWDHLILRLTSGHSVSALERINNTLTSYKEELMEAFGYEEAREALLNRVAVMVNVKTCLYCNQQYTIVVGKKPRRDGGISLTGSKAFLQFDHFFEKSDYPFLSMSLYNLIPSCAVCNQKKSKTRFSLSLHPYIADYSADLTFRIKDYNALTNPRYMKFDFMEVEIDTNGNEELGLLMQKLQMAKRYWRHLDVVKDIEIAKLLHPYYDKLIKGSFEGKMGEEIKKFDKEVLKRNLYGFYTKSEDINNRPLTKFSQDIYDQLK